MGRVNLWAVRRAGRLAHGDGRIHTYLHESDLQSVEAGRRAAGGRAERGRRCGAREPYAENVALPGLRFTWAFMLSYGGSPMGVLAYVGPLGAPVLLCILANGAADAPTNQGGDLLLAWWSRNGRSHLVIGHVPEKRAVALAQMIEKQV